MRKKLKGMFTVEALFVTSIVIMTLWSMILFVLDMHDSTVEQIREHDMAIESVFGNMNTSQKITKKMNTDVLYALKIIMDIGENMEEK